MYPWKNHKHLNFCLSAVSKTNMFCFHLMGKLSTYSVNKALCGLASFMILYMHIPDEGARLQNNNNINFFHIFSKGLSKFVTEGMLFSMFRYLCIYLNTAIEQNYSGLTELIFVKQCWAHDKRMLVVGIIIILINQLPNEQSSKIKCSQV